MGLNIIEAAKALKEGKKIRRNTWKDGSYLYHPEDHVTPQLFIENRRICSKELTVDELLADDWEVIEEKSAMEKAWEEEAKGWALTDRSSARDFFYRGWKAHEDHIKTIHKT